MKIKFLENNLSRLSVQITYQDERFLGSIYTITGIGIIIANFFGIIQSVLKSVANLGIEMTGFYYIAGVGILTYGLFRLYRSFTVNKCIFDKFSNKLKIEQGNIGKSNFKEYLLSSVVGVEEVSTSKVDINLFVWLKKGDQIRGERVLVTKASDLLKLQILWREISEFLKDQPVLILGSEWTIEQDKNTFRIYRSFDVYRNSDLRTYTLDKRIDSLVYELDGTEIGRYKASEIKDIETEINPDRDDEESSDRIILKMIDGSVTPISLYWYYTGGHALVVRALKYGVGLQNWLHISPGMRQEFQEFYTP